MHHARQNHEVKSDKMNDLSYWAYLNNAKKKKGEKKNKKGGYIAHLLLSSLLLVGLSSPLTSVLADTANNQTQSTTSTTSINPSLDSVGDTTSSFVQLDNNFEPISTSSTTTSTDNENSIDKEPINLEKTTYSDSALNGQQNTTQTSSAASTKNTDVVRSLVDEQQTNALDKVLSGDNNQVKTSTQYATAIQSVSINARNFLVGGNSYIDFTSSNIDLTNAKYQWTITSGSGVISLRSNTYNITWLDALKAGTAKLQLTITTSDNKTFTDTKDINVYDKTVGLQGLYFSGNYNVNLGDTTTIKANLRPLDTTVMTDSWTSKNTNVATVDSKGNVKAVGVGSTQITYVVFDTNGSGLVGSFDITVTDPALQVTSTWNLKSVMIQIGTTSQIPVTVTNQNLVASTTWSSSDPNVISVDNNGNITGKSSGIATITQTITTTSGQKVIVSKDFSARAGVPLLSVSTIVPSNKVLTYSPSTNNGQSVQLSSVINPTNATVTGTEYKSTDESVLKVDQSGKVTAVGPGSATIINYTRDDYELFGSETVFIVIDSDYVNERLNQPIISTSTQFQFPLYNSSLQDIENRLNDPVLYNFLWKSRFNLKNETYFTRYDWKDGTTKFGANITQEGQNGLFTDSNGKQYTYAQLLNDTVNYMNNAFKQYNLPVTFSTSNMNVDQVFQFGTFYSDAPSNELGTENNGGGWQDYSYTGPATIGINTKYIPTNSYSNTIKLLAHEMLHGASLDHSSNPISITGVNQTGLVPSDIQDNDIAALQARYLLPSGISARLFGTVNPDNVNDKD